MQDKYKDIGTIDDRLIEELGELIQAISKGRRFGWFNHHPDRQDSNNWVECKHEISDVYKRLDEFVRVKENELGI